MGPVVFAAISTGFIAENNSTSLMSIAKVMSGRVCGAEAEQNVLVELVRNITRRSIPIPHPPVGGRPCSSLRDASVTKHVYRSQANLRVNEGLVDALRFVVALLLLPHLLLEPQPLLERIVQLGVGVAELLPAHEALEPFAEPWS